MIKIAICDDEQLHLDHTAHEVESAASDYLPEIRTFLDGNTLLCAVKDEGYQPDIAILDIKMAGVSGIDIAKQLNGQVPDCGIIFLTGYLTYATDVYETEHCYFILKEELKVRIRPAVDRALSCLNNKKTERITVKTGMTFVSIAISDILYFERMGHRTRILTSDSEYFAYARPPALLKNVGSGLFVRCHQSYWVNREKIMSLEKN